MKLFSLFLSFIFTSGIFYSASAQEYKWKAGVSSEIMTPTGRMWLGGYGFRDHPAEGVMQDLWVKALALSDSQGETVLLITLDMAGIPKTMAERLGNALHKKFKIDKSHIMFNSSHTHSGPVIIDELNDYYEVKFTSEDFDTIASYTKILDSKILSCAEKAIRGMKPAYVSTGNGFTRFAVNRRNNVEALTWDFFETNGPNDYAVPVIKVEDLSGKILSIVCGYACHATACGTYLWSPDYPGYARLELERLYPGATALFFQGCGGDQNPLPRRGTIPPEALARKYGKELAAAVECALADSSLHRQPSRLKTAYNEIDLPFSEPPSVEELKNISDSSAGYDSTWANRLLSDIQKTGPLKKSYPYPIQIWTLGDQPIFSMGGEVCVEYAQQLKRMFGYHVFVMAYNNDVMAYIPSAKVLKEGGYEGATSMMSYNHMSSPWGAGVEVNILSGMQALAKQIGLPQVQRKIINR